MLVIVSYLITLKTKLQFLNGEQGIINNDI